MTLQVMTKDGIEDVELLWEGDDPYSLIVGPDYTRHWTDLPHKDKLVLEAIQTAEDIEKLELAGKWEDDHIMCWGLRINGVGIGFWWYDDYIGRENEWLDKASVFDHLIDIRTREYD